MLHQYTLQATCNLVLEDLAADLVEALVAEVFLAAELKMKALIQAICVSHQRDLTVVGKAAVSTGNILQYSSEHRRCEQIRVIKLFIVTRIGCVLRTSLKSKVLCVVFGLFGEHLGVETPFFIYKLVVTSVFLDGAFTENGNLVAKTAGT